MSAITRIMADLVRRRDKVQAAIDGLSDYARNYPVVGDYFCQSCEVCSDDWDAMKEHARVTHHLFSPRPPERYP